MSIVSVYCKSLLRLFIAGVYCKYLLCFIVFSVQNVARSLVLLRFRLQKLIFECVLLCFCSHMCKKHYKTSQQSCFCAYQLAKPFVLPLQIFAPSKTRHFVGLLWKNPSENDTAFAIGGRSTTNLVHALCVFLCIPLFEHN